ncbi:MAG: CPBP family intramembrane metalloprotease [Methylococcales bacterium]|nr:CPBP family intramembrane metalloprotease [Methylococcales bacterium]
MNYLRYSLAPLALLIFLALIACVLSYLILMIAGDLLPLRKLVSKGTLIFLILSLFPLRHYLNLSWNQIGFAPKTIFFKQLFLGIGLGVLTLLPLLIVLYGLDVHVIDTSRSWTILKAVERIAIALLLALLISFAEEPLFRGLLLTSLRKKMAVAAAIGISSTYYAALHFLKSKTPISYEDVQFSSGFKLLGEAFSNWLNPDILSAFIGLFMVGVFLAVIRTQVKQSLGLCIGYHASWVWQIKVSKDFFNTNQQSEYLYLVSSYDGLVGPLVSLWMLLLASAYLGYQFFYRQRSHR